MTTVFVRRAERGIVSLTVGGHAGFARSGRDIVCAAASVLITTCANALESVAGVQPEVVQEEEAAKISVSLPEGLPADREHDAQIIMQTTLQGFEDIAQAYPHNLQIK